MCARLLLVAAGLAGGPRLAASDPAAVAKIAIIKADDVRRASPKWKAFIACSRARGVKVACGVICVSLAEPDPSYREWLVAQEASGGVEFWNHGWDHQRWDGAGVEVCEFDGSGLAHQRDHLTRSQALLGEVLGHVPVAFGAPFNKIDDDTLTVLAGDLGLKLFFGFKDPGVAGIAPALMTLRGEADGTGRPNFAKFVAAYRAMATPPAFAAIQFHPESFPDASYLQEYAQIIDFLAAEGWTFLLPREYLARVSTEAPNRGSE